MVFFINVIFIDKKEYPLFEVKGHDRGAVINSSKGVGADATPKITQNLPPHSELVCYVFAPPRILSISILSNMQCMGSLKCLHINICMGTRING